MQILVTAATILGILFGASFIDVNKVLEEGSVESFSKGIFWVSIFIFLAASCYITAFGMRNSLRYYYMQELEDRLRYLIPESDDDKEAGGPFLHWNSFQGPLITCNHLHITSRYAALHFVSYNAAIFFVVLFSIMLLALEFLQLPSPTGLDRFGIWAVGIAMLIFLLSFIVTASSAKKMVDFSRETARKNLEAREAGVVDTQYQGAAEFRRFLRYLIYPKSSDLQKPLLIIIGYIGGIMLSGQGLAPENCFHLVVALIVFDVLAYQARYQINDIRGIKEDHGRLMPEGEIKPEYIKISLLVAAGRAALAILFVVIGPSAVRLPLTVCLVFLTVSTIVYEVAREKQSTWGIYIFVGPGYPLRIFLGLWIAYPAFLKYEGVSGWQFLLLGGALWAYGSFSSLLSWARQVSEKMEAKRTECSQFPVSYKKKHFMAIQSQIMERYLRSESRRIEHVYPLREQGQINDPWAIWYLLMLGLFCLALLLHRSATIVMRVTEILAVSLFGLAATDEYKAAVCFVALGNILTVISSITSWSAGGTFAWYTSVCILQIIVTITYCFLRCGGQSKQGHLFLKILSRIGKLVVGAEVWEYVGKTIPAEQKLPRQ